MNLQSDTDALTHPIDVNDTRASSSARRDLLLVVAATLFMAVVSVNFELSEALQDWSRRWERYQLDELLGIALFGALALTWFILRRMQETRTELRRRIVLERELAAALAENRRLSRAHVQVQEEERRRLARELHDELGQHLNAIKIEAVSIRQCASYTLPEAHRAAVSVIGIADHLHALVRDMTRRLRPAGLDELGLSAALENYVEAWRGRSPHLQLDLTMKGNFDDLGEALNITLYRLIQEGLTNVSRHANARRVEIRLQRTAIVPSVRDEVVLSLTDDGTGAQSERSSAGLGLIGMRERVEALGGRTEAVSEVAGGFRVSAWLPVERVSA
ncbi:MAG: two-component system, NarL family, sensor histidine kinase UhpB [Betaproteobacteria bacterium]|jgi:signal transduction histidine kinase